MNTIAIDSNALNNLFDNQKKLDDLFDSIFDDNSFFINSAPSSQTVSRKSTVDIDRQITYGSGNVKESLLGIKHNTLFYMLPIVLEIALFYLAVTNLLY
jgi:hypothetical protein